MLQLLLSSYIADIMSVTCYLSWKRHVQLVPRSCERQTKPSQEEDCDFRTKSALVGVLKRHVLIYGQWDGSASASGCIHITDNVVHVHRTLLHSHSGGEENMRAKQWGTSGEGHIREDR